MKMHLFSAKNIPALILAFIFVAALMFTIKAIAEDWNGKIGDTKTVQLDPSQCTGNGSAGPCYKTLTCAPASTKCECTEEGDWN